MTFKQKTAKNGESYLEASGHALASTYNPSNQASLWAAAFVERLQGYDQCVLIGGGSGFELMALKALGVNGVILFEPVKEVIAHIQTLGGADHATVVTELAELPTHLNKKSLFFSVVNPFLKFYIIKEHERAHHLLTCRTRSGFDQWLQLNPEYGVYTAEGEQSLSIKNLKIRDDQVSSTAQKRAELSIFLLKELVR